jgi:hypothetical protein
MAGGVFPAAHDCGVSDVRFSECTEGCDKQHAATPKHFQANGFLRNFI